jgi:serine/threonine protein kinase
VTTELVSGVNTGSILDGRYRLEDVIATGGMGAIFRGTDLVLDRPVAVKTIHPHLATTSHAARFLHEAETLAALAHPNLVAVYDSGTQQGLPYLVMEYIQGESLASILQREGPVDPGTGTALAVEICKGLAYAHSRGVIHRDIKPQNLLVTPDGQVKIVDFGIARGPQSAEMTETGSVIGTAYYLAPEVAAGGGASVRSDLYSLGVVLYRLFTGRLPFEGNDPVAVAVKHRTASVPPPSSIRPGLPRHIEASLMRLLEKLPSRRYANAAAAAAALQDLDHAAVVGARYSGPQADEPTTMWATNPGSAGVSPARAGRPARHSLRKSDVIIAAVALASAAAILFRLLSVSAAPPEQPPPAATVPESSQPAVAPPSNTQPVQGGVRAPAPAPKPKGKKND